MERLLHGFKEGACREDMALLSCWCGRLVAAVQIRPRSAKETTCSPADDEVVEDAHVHQRQRRLQRLRQELVGTARFGRPARMVVRQCYRGGVLLQRALHDLARVDRGLRQRAAEHLDRAEQPVLRVEEQHDEDFVLQAGELQIATSRASPAAIPSPARSASVRAGRASAVHAPRRACVRAARRVLHPPRPRYRSRRTPGRSPGGRPGGPRARQGRAGRRSDRRVKGQTASAWRSPWVHRRTNGNAAPAGNGFPSGWRRKGAGWGR